MEFKRLFPEVPEDLSALGDEKLHETLRDMGAVSAQLKAEDADAFLVAEFGEQVSKPARDAEAVKQWQDAAADATRIKAQLAANDEAEKATAEAADELHSAFEVEAEPVAELAAETEDEDDDEKPAPDDEASAEVEEPEATVEETAVEPEAEVAEVVQASAAPRMTPRFAVPKSNQAREVADDTSGRAVLLASAGNHGLSEGKSLDRMGFAQALIDRARKLGPVRQGPGWRDGLVHPVAHVDFPFPDEFTLGRDGVENFEKILGIGNPYFPESVANMGRFVRQADGGICAPPTPFYDLPEFWTTRRPVRDALPSFRATRGGVSIPGATGIDTAAEAVTVITAAEDGQGGTYATKSCLDMDCATWVDTFVDTLSHCRTYGNLNTITWPEGVAIENSKTMAIFARIAEGRLLEKLDALLLNLTANVAYGTSSTVLYALSISRAGIISRLRMDDNTRFQVILPFWLRAMFSMDIVNGQFDRFSVTPDQVEALISRFGFDVTWHLDEATGVGATEEIWNDEVTASVQNDWPGSTVIARLFPRNHVLHLDTGTLDFGVTRDIDHNAQNVYAVQGEIFESLALVGPPQAGHRLAITTCPDGRVAAPETTELTCQTS
jgi:hypothetical protein